MQILHISRSLLTLLEFFKQLSLHMQFSQAF